MNVGMGRIVYENGSCILRCSDDEISKYYRHLFHIKHFKAKEIHHSGYDSHVTIVSDRDSGKFRKSKRRRGHKNWGKYEGQRAFFYYENRVEQKGKYWFISVKCPMLEKIRNGLELEDRNIRPHITVGVATKRKGK